MCSQARPSTRGVACPVQWLPLLLTAALPSTPPPPSPQPPPSSGTVDLNEELSILLVALLVAAVVLLMLGCRRILRHRADRRAYRADREHRRASRRAKRRADRRAKRSGLKKGPSRDVPKVVQTRVDVSKLPGQQPATLTDARATLPPARPVRREYSDSARSYGWRSRRYSTGLELRDSASSAEGRPTLPPGPPSSSCSRSSSWSGGLSYRTNMSDSGREQTGSGRSRSPEAVASPPHAAPAPVLPGALTASPCANECSRRPLSSTSTAPLAAPTVDLSPSLLRRGNVSARPNKRPAVESASALGAKRAFTSPYVEFCRVQRPLLPAETSNRDREKLLGVHTPFPCPAIDPDPTYGNPMILVVAVCPIARLYTTSPSPPLPLHHMPTVSPPSPTLVPNRAPASS